MTLEQYKDLSLIIEDWELYSLYIVIYAEGKVHCFLIQHCMLSSITPAISLYFIYFELFYNEMMIEFLLLIIFFFFVSRVNFTKQSCSDHLIYSTCSLGCLLHVCMRSYHNDPFTIHNSIIICWITRLYIYDLISLAYNHIRHTRKELRRQNTSSPGWQNTLPWRSPGVKDFDSPWSADYRGGV